MINKKDVLNKIISLRVTGYNFNQMVLEAEEKNMSVPDVIRSAWNEHQNSKDLNDILSGVEQRLVRKMFEIVCSVAGVDEQERLVALKKFKTRMRES